MKMTALVAGMENTFLSQDGLSLLKLEGAVIHLKDSNFNLDQEVVYLVGDGNISNNAITPFSDIVCELLADISVSLMKHKDASDYPDLIAFSFWCRKANLTI